MHTYFIQLTLRLFSADYIDYYLHLHFSSLFSYNY